MIGPHEVVFLAFVCSSRIGCWCVGGVLGLHIRVDGKLAQCVKFVVVFSVGIYERRTFFVVFIVVAFVLVGA